MMRLRLGVGKATVINDGDGRRLRRTLSNARWGCDVTAVTNGSESVWLFRCEDLPEGLWNDRSMRLRYIFYHDIIEKITAVEEGDSVRTKWRLLWRGTERGINRWWRSRTEMKTQLEVWEILRTSWHRGTRKNVKTRWRLRPSDCTCTTEIVVVRLVERGQNYGNRWWR